MTGPRERASATARAARRMRIALRLVVHPSELTALIRALSLFAIAELLLRRTDLPRAAGHLGAALVFTDRPTSTDTGALDLTPSERRDLRMLARLAPRWPFGPPGGCLRHALSAACVLRRRAPVLRLAVSTASTPAVSAHAWLEVSGVAVTDPGQAFVPLLPNGGATG